MYQVLLVVQLLVAFALIALILVQQGRGADAGASFGGGASGSIFGSRGPATFLAKITALLAAVFFANSIGLAFITTQSVQRRSVVEQFQGEGMEQDTPVLPQQTTSDVPVPVEGAGSGTVSDVPDTRESQ
ncbi:MAG TPA: preprotein translocase subunit SecG [Gammaproteobacteria bacterium]|jgi:preprotein translocase subunit SecG